MTQVIKKPLFKQLYVQVLLAIVLGILLGVFEPELGLQLKVWAFFFIKAIKMIITPIIFLSLVSGMTAVRSLKTTGKIGGGALVYFISMTFIALCIGLVLTHVLQPGAGVDAHLSDFDSKDIEQYTGQQLTTLTFSQFLMNIMPSTFVSAFVDGEILQILLVAVLFSVALLQLGQRAQPVIEGVQLLLEIFFKIIAVIVRFAPLGAFAAMGYTVAKYGLSSLIPMAYLLLCFYLTCVGFIVIGLGLVLKLYCRINIFSLLRYIKDELLIVLGTSSSESVLPLLLTKLEQLGCDRSVVSLVLPVGYSFNLDGTCIYLTMGAMYITQAFQIDLSLGQQLGLLGLMLLTSKGAAGITGSGFIILAATLSMIGHIPTAGVILILGVDRFMSEGRAITNMIGNCIATIVIAKWQGRFDEKCASSLLHKQA